MISSPTDKLLATLELEVGIFRFYKNIIISEMKEGVTVTFDNTLPVFVKGLELYTVDDPLFYISNRKNSYSFDPTLYVEAKAVFSNLRGYAVVVYDDMNSRIAQMEQNFLDCPVKIFHSLDEAKEWAQGILDKE